MSTYIAFLRAINLGAKRRFPKDEIKGACEDAGFSEVETYLNTGNVRVTSRLRSPEKVAQTLEAAFAKTAGFEVPTIVFTQAEFAAIAADAEELYAERELARHYIYLLKQPLTGETAKTIEARSTGEHRVVIRGRAAHVLLGASYQQGEVDPLNVAKVLGVATNRNYNVVTTLAQKWC